MEFGAQTEIDRPAAEVWAVLTDLEGWPAWDSGVLETSGTVALGAKVRVRSAADPKRSFATKVVELEAPTRMAWKGGMPLGLFTGRRSFTLAEHGTTTSVTVREVFSGPLVPVLGRTIPDLEPSIRQFVTGLKERVEASPHA